MSRVRVKQDGTKVTSPGWLVIPSVLLGWTINRRRHLGVRGRAWMVVTRPGVERN
jgi:hypothetical protein